MTVEGVQIVAAALVIMAGALATCALILAKSYVQVRQLIDGLHAVGVPVKPGSPPVPVPPIGGVAGGAGTSPQLGILPVVPVNQATGDTVSPVPTPTGPFDCGPACVVSVIGEVKGCWSADALLRLRYFGVVDSRLTTPEDLVGMLAGNGIVAHVRRVDFASMQIEVTRNAEAMRPSIVLGDFVTPGFGHWMKFLGADPDPVFMNPWPNGRQSWTWADIASAYSGVYVHIDTFSDALAS